MFSRRRTTRKLCLLILSNVAFKIREFVSVCCQSFTMEKRQVKNLLKIAKISSRGTLMLESVPYLFFFHIAEIGLTPMTVRSLYQCMSQCNTTLSQSVTCTFYVNESVISTASVYILASTLNKQTCFIVPQFVKTLKIKLSIF